MRKLSYAEAIACVHPNLIESIENDFGTFR
jgi:hypothetical protein